MWTYVLPRVLHVLGVVLWIGGVAFVTTVLLPAVRDEVPEAERVAFFERIERRFAWQARATTLLTGLTGFWMVHVMDVWHWFLEPTRWYLHAMVLVWLVFTAMLFVLEPLVLDAYLQRRAAQDPAGTFERIWWLHVGLLGMSLVAVLGAVAGAHGWLLHLG